MKALLTIETLIKFFMVSRGIMVLNGSFLNGSWSFQDNMIFKTFPVSIFPKTFLKEQSLIVRACLQVWQKFHTNLGELTDFYSSFYNIKEQRYFVTEPYIIFLKRCFSRSELIHYNSLMGQAKFLHDLLKVFIIEFSIPWNHPFNTYVKFFWKLTFPTPWFAHLSK